MNLESVNRTPARAPAGNGHAATPGTADTTEAAMTTPAHAPFDPATDSIPLGRFRLTPTGLAVEGEPDRPEWEECGRRLRALEKGLQWCIGDWLRYGENRSWNDIGMAAIIVGVEKQTVKNATWVASVFDSSRRRDELSFSHHAEVAPLPVEQQDELLDWCEEQLQQGSPNPRSRSELRERVRELRVAPGTGGGEPEQSTGPSGRFFYPEVYRKLLFRLFEVRRSWPDGHRSSFPMTLRAIADDLESWDDVEREFGLGESDAEGGPADPGVADEVA
jgi:hypothetical protein